MIFGADGQDGYYLAQACMQRGIDPISVAFTGVSLHGDVSDYARVTSLIKMYKPDLIFHFAAQSTTRHDALFANHAAISTGTINILEAVRINNPAARVFIAGSGVQFQNSGLPISEQTPFEASSPYAVARIHAVYASRYYRSLGLKVYNGYLFHHDSPFRKQDHVSQLIARNVQAIALGKISHFELGDITVEKEWTFAGDTVEGMLDLVLQDTVFEAVIGSGVTYSIQQWLQECFVLIGKDWQEFVRCRGGFSPEYKKLVSNPSTMFSLGWRPKTSFSQLARIMMHGEYSNVSEK